MYFNEGEEQGALIQSKNKRTKLMATFIVNSTYSNASSIRYVDFPCFSPGIRSIGRGNLVFSTRFFVLRLHPTVFQGLHRMSLEGCIQLAQEKEKSTVCELCSFVFWCKILPGAVQC